MAKNIIHDVTVKNKRSIREISIERGGRSVRNDVRKIDVGDNEKKKMIIFPLKLISKS